MVCSGKLISSSVFGSASIALKIVSANSGLTCTGKTPIFKQFPLKMSAKKLETTALNP